MRKTVKYIVHGIHDIYAPIMVILFTNVKFAHSVTMSNLCSYIDL